MGLVNRWMGIRQDGWMNKWMDGMDEQMDE